MMALRQEFYKTFASNLSKCLLAVYEEAIANKFLPTSLRQSVIMLLPKPQKDTLLLENWRPISLLNNDYKVMAAVFANGKKNVLSEINDKTQCGFMKGRHISFNICLVIN